jgi:hypothetical protein
VKANVVLIKLPKKLMKQNAVKVSVALNNLL